MGDKPGLDLDWWQRWPELLRAELDAFAARGAATSIVHQAHGVLMLKVDWPRGDAVIPLYVGYSPFHPHCRPQVSAPEMEDQRHRNAINGGLCLIAQGNGMWDQRELAADLIEVQLDRIFEANALRAEDAWGAAGAVEENVPDAILPHFAGTSEDMSAVLFGSIAVYPSAPAGPADFVIQFRTDQGARGPFEAVLEQCRPLDGPWLAQKFTVPGATAKTQRISGRWIRLSVAPGASPMDILANVEAKIDQLSLIDRRYAALKMAPTADFHITAVRFEDELAYGPQGRGETCLFVVSRRQRSKSPVSARFVRGFQIGDRHNERLPVAKTLSNKRALLIGCGGIGGFAALELARAGIGNLHVVDFDILEPGNSVRWPLGRPFWGFDKAAALFWFIKTNYPWTEVTGWRLRVGETIGAPNQVSLLKDNQREQLQKLVVEADIVIDTSASDECQFAIAALCRDLGRPLVVGYATEGVAGGIVARFRPERPGCFVCLHNHWSEGTIPLPPIDTNGSLVPLGCNEPTFTGGAFDLQEVSLEVVRSAVGLLAPDDRDPGDWDWSSLDLRNGELRILPTWQYGMIAPRTGCPCGSTRHDSAGA